MNGGSKIVDLRVSDVPYDATADVEGYAMDVETDDDTVQTGPWPRIFGVAAIIFSLLWVGFIGWYSLPALMPAPQPLALAQIAAALAAIPALIGVLWLIARRSSRAEARRFAGTARSMREEAAHLQQVIEAMTHTIEANRLALADQVTSMMAAASGMADQISMAETQAARLDAAARTAEQKLSVLMATLPRAHADTEALAGKIESTGLTASERASALDAAIVALAERGREADALTSGAAERLAAHIARMEATSESAGARLESVTSSMSDAVDGLLGRTASAVEEAHKGIAAQGDAMLAMLATNQAAIDRTATDSTAALAERIAAIETVVNHISATLGDSQTQIDGLTRSIDDSSGAAQRFAGEAAPQLLDSLIRIRDTANAAADHAKEAMERLIPVAGKAIETAGSHAVEASLSAIATATETAAQSASEASDRLNRQMLEIAEASAQIEARISEAQESDGFARRVSLLIETLNSQAIDISGIYATEVSDSAWANYLRGDRGAFARRAVRLLDAGEVRAIANAYQDDATVHEQVNRYIHDFEAMLRNVLAHRDSAPLGVTLLSSDMGKLYVALAQAIERLRA
jgi:hypothetical protein